jgi:hypothetical protein
MKSVLASFAALLLTTLLTPRDGFAQAVGNAANRPGDGSIRWDLIEWRLGVAYASGVRDVADLYEDNLRLAGFDVNVDLKFPLGVAGAIRYDWASGVRADIGLGPVFVIGGDVRHLEVPLSITAGYNFMRLADVSPYVRGGVIHHFADGDQSTSSSPGLLVAVGLDFTHFSLEVAADRSEVEFDRLVCGAGQPCRLTTTELNTYEILASFYWRFN